MSVNELYPQLDNQSSCAGCRRWLDDQVLTQINDEMFCVECRPCDNCNGTAEIRERELERQLRYVLQKSQRYTEAVAQYLEASLRVAEESSQGHNLDGVLKNSSVAATDERHARTLLDYSIKLARHFLEPKEQVA